MVVVVVEEEEEEERSVQLSPVQSRRSRPAEMVSTNPAIQHMGATDGLAKTLRSWSGIFVTSGSGIFVPLEAAPQS